MKIYVVINKNNVPTEDIYYNTEIYIAPTHAMANLYALKNDISEEQIKEIELGKEVLSLCGATERIDINNSDENSTDNSSNNTSRKLSQYKKILNDETEDDSLNDTQKIDSLNVITYGDYSNK